MRKKNYIEYYHLSTGIGFEYNDNLAYGKKIVQVPKVNIPMCGSDSELWYDGRLCLSNIICEAYKGIDNFRNIHTDITGFKIYKNGCEIYSNVK